MTMKFVVIAVALVAACGSPAHARSVSLTDVSESIEALTERVRRAVVLIRVTGVEKPALEADTTEQLIPTARSTGSGVLLSDDGYIVTNHHVVEGAETIFVSVLAEPDGTTRKSVLEPKSRDYRAIVVGIDEETDLALLKIDAKGLPHLELGDSDDVGRGAIVLAFGSPLGLESSVSMGIVSAPARQLDPEHPVVYIQTDASINPGNSGGPLVDTRGYVVGLSTFILSEGGGSEGLSFAIPSNIVRNVVDQIRQHGRVRRGMVGLYAQTITPEMAAGLGIDRQRGVIVGDVSPLSPADRAGIQVGDVVLSLNGKTMENGRQFNVNVYKRSIGSIVEVTLVRAGKKMTVKMTVGERPADSAGLSSKMTRKKNLVRELGILAIDVDDVDELALRTQSGIYVAGVSEESPAIASPLLAEDVIHQLNGTVVRNLAELRVELAKLTAGSAVVVQIERKGRFAYVAFKL